MGLRRQAPTFDSRLMSGRMAEYQLNQGLARRHAGDKCDSIDKTLIAQFVITHIFAINERTDHG